MNYHFEQVAARSLEQYIQYIENGYVTIAVDPLIKEEVRAYLSAHKDDDDLHKFFYAIQALRKEEDEECFKILKELVDHGFSRAENALGFHYEFGLGTEKDVEKAAFHYRNAIAIGYAPAFGNLANILRRYYDDDESEQEALRLDYEGAERGCFRSMHFLYIAYDDGEYGLEKDRATALKYISKAAEMNDGYGLIVMADAASDEAAELSFLKRAEDVFYGPVYARFGQLYFYKEKTDPSYFQLAESYLLKSLAYEKNEVGYYLALLYSDHGMKKEAKHVARECAHIYVPCLRVFMSLAMKDNDPEDNIAEFFPDLEELIIDRDVVSALMLGECYEKGIGTEKDLNEAYYHYYMAAREDDSRGLYEFGRVCLELDKKEEGVTYLKKAVKEGSKEAEKLLVSLDSDNL